MSQKNETLPLLLALVISLGIIGGISWFILQRLGVNLGNITQQPSTPSSPSTNQQQTFADIQAVPEGLFNHGGSTTWAPIREEVDLAMQTVWPRFRLRYTDPTTGTPGSSSGIKMLINNQLSFSESSRSLKDEEYQQAQQRGFTLKEIPVAIDGIAIAVHPDLPISGLTLAQLKDIYTGKITNWNQLGGPNLAITPYSRSKEDGGTVEFFIENVLGKEDFGSNVQSVYSTTLGIREVAENKGGIYYASAPEIVPQCTIKALPLGRTVEGLVTPYQEPFVPLSECPNKRNQVNESAFQNGDYPITRRLFVIVKQNGQVDEQAGLAYANLLLTNQGQTLITEAGFVRIR